MHSQWQGLSTTVSNHVDRLWRLIAQRTLLGGRYTDRGVSQTSHVGEGAPAPPLQSPPLPFPFPSSLPFLPLPSTVQPALFPISPLLYLPFPPFPLRPLPSLPSPSRPLHSLPLPLEVGLLIAANGSGSALAPSAGPGRAKRYLVYFKLKISPLVAENETSNWGEEVADCQWQGVNTTFLSPAHRLWCLIAQMTLLGGRYTGAILAIVNGVITPWYLAVK